MDEKNYTGLIPPHETGVLIDTASSEAFDHADQAKAFFEVVKQRLQDVNHWHELAGKGGAHFQLFDHEGHEVSRKVEEGDYFRIDIPGPGSKTGDGYDWVRVEETREVSEENVNSVGIRVRPSSNPLNKDSGIAHFYSADSTSTFIVTREDKKVTATVYDRNTKPNTDTEGIVDTIRQVVAGIGGIFGGSKLQWKGLAKGLVSRDDQ